MSGNILAVRREDKNPWEKRAPLIPTHVRELIHEQNVTILIQTSQTRVFQDQEYEQEGAAVLDDISGSKIILAIKEVPLDLIVEERVYLFFSHHQRPGIQPPYAKKTKRIRMYTDRL